MANSSHTSGDAQDTGASETQEQKAEEIDALRAVLLSHEDRCRFLLDWSRARQRRIQMVVSQVRRAFLAYTDQSSTLAQVHDGHQELWRWLGVLCKVVGVDVGEMNDNSDDQQWDRDADFGPDVVTIDR